MAALKGAAIFVLSDQHEQSSRDKYRKTCSGAFRELFVEHYVGEQYRHEDTKLVYRNNNACRTVLKRLVVAQPGAAGSKSREGYEQHLGTCLSSPRSLSALPVTGIISHAITRTTAVRIAVPRSELTPSIPILPSIEVSAANTAERIA